MAWPVSTQFWIIAGGIAHCVRLAYDKAWAKKAVGNVHTNMILRHLLDEDHVDGLSFGYGSETSKAKWMREHRILYGLMAFNPYTRAGLRYGLKNILGSFFKKCFVVWPTISYLRLMDEIGVRLVRGWKKRQY